MSILHYYEAIRNLFLDGLVDKVEYSSKKLSLFLEFLKKNMTNYNFWRFETSLFYFVENCCQLVCNGIHIHDLPDKFILAGELFEKISNIKDYEYPNIEYAIIFSALCYYIANNYNRYKLLENIEKIEYDIKDIIYTFILKHTRYLLLNKKQNSIDESINIDTSNKILFYISNGFLDLYNRKKDTAVLNFEIAKYYILEKGELDYSYYSIMLLTLLQAFIYK